MTPDFLALFSGIVARTTATLLVALAATLLMRRASAAARHLVWTVALGGVLVLPFLGALVPVWRVVPVPRITVTAAAPSVIAEPVVAAEPAAGAAAAPIPAPARAPVPWAKVVAGVWMTGALLVLARLAAGVARIWWMERRSVELADAGWTSLADGLARRLRLGRIVTLLRGEHATVPMTWGIVRPVVLLPAGSEGWSDERRTVVLAHELAHIRRWDALTQWIAHVAVAAHWYNPLVWVAARKLRQEREQACDDAVLALGARPTVYADHLLDIVRALGASQGPAAALAMARRSQFEGRMLAILDAAARRGAVSRRLLLGTTAAAALLLVPLAALRAADAGTPAAPLPAPVVSAAPAPPAPAPPAAAVKPEAPVTAPKPVAAALPASAPPSVLAEAARDGRSDDELLEVVRAARGIVSSAERRQVLVAVLRQPRVSPVVVSAVMDATAGMNESSAVREVLNEATLRHSVSGAGVRDALLRAVRRISSAAEQRTVLVTLMTRQQLVPECLAEVLGAVPSIASDEERRQVLVSAARLQRVVGPARTAYTAAASSVLSQSERAAVLTALVGSAPSAPSTPSEPSAPSRPSAPSAGREIWDATHNNEHEADDGSTRRVSITARRVERGPGGEVRAILPGGSLRVEEKTRSGEVRLATATPGANGIPEYRYRVDGEARPFDASARRWLTALLEEARRQ